MTKERSFGGFGVEYREAHEEKSANVLNIN